MSQGWCQGLRCCYSSLPAGRGPWEAPGRKASDSDQRDGAASSGGEAVRPELKAAFFLKKWCLGRLSASLPAVMFMWLSLGAWEKGPLCYFLSHSQNKRCFQEVALQLGRSRAMTPGSAGVDDSVGSPEAGAACARERAVSGFHKADPVPTLLCDTPAGLSGPWSPHSQTSSHITWEQSRPRTASH